MLISAVQRDTTFKRQDAAPMPKARPGWLTFTQAAAKLGVDRTTLWRWRRDNRWGLRDKVRAHEQGREVYLNEADLEAWDRARWGEDDSAER